MGQLITNWVTGGGIAAVLILMAVESCGIPFPSEVIMPVAGYFAATGRLNLVAVIIAGTVGNLIGSLAAYWLLRRLWPAPRPGARAEGRHLSSTSRPRRPVVRALRLTRCLLRTVALGDPHVHLVPGRAGA